MNIADALIFGKKVNNHIIDATDNAATNLKWTSTTEQEYTVPGSKRWILIGGNVNRSDSGTIAITIKDAANKIIMTLGYGAAAAGRFAYPNSAGSVNQQDVSAVPIILDAGEYVHIVCGVAQGAGAYASCVVIEVSV